jgi:hypothetical protein
VKPVHAKHHMEDAPAKPAGSGQGSDATRTSTARA